MTYYNNAHRPQTHRMRPPTFAPPPIPPPPFGNKFDRLYDDAIDVETAAVMAATAVKSNGKKASVAVPIYEQPSTTTTTVPPPPRRFYRELERPLLRRRYDLLFDQPQLRRVRFDVSFWLVWSGLIVLAVGAFVALMLLREFPQGPWLAVAKNSALVSAVTFALLGFTVDRVYANKETWLLHAHRALAAVSFAFALSHVVAHAVLLAEAASAETRREDVAATRALRYARDRAFLYATGLGMLVALAVLLACAGRGVRKRRYNVFYYAHVVGSGTFVVLGVAHSPWYALAVFYPVSFVYLPRVLRRWCVRSRVSSVQIGRDYALITLAVYRSWLNRALLINGLARRMSDLWLVCPSFGSLERHPFTVLETIERESCAYVKLLIWRYGDWKSKVYGKLLANRHLELYSHGLRTIVDETRVSDLMSDEALRSSNVLFVLENAGISSFVAYANYLCATPKTHDRARNVVLHYRVEDTSVLALLEETLERLRGVPSVSANAHVYTSTDATFEGEATRRATRLNYRRILKSFFRTTDDGCVTRRQALEEGSVFVYSNDETLRERIVRQMRRWIRKGYYEGCEGNDDDDDDVSNARFTKPRKINLIL